MATATKRLNTTHALVISYLRFSLAVQSKGDSTRRQTDLAKTWCEKNGKKLTDRLDDKGISAFRGRNSSEGALSSFLELVKAGTVPEGSTLLVEELDRLSRQEPEESLHLFLSIIRSGITLVTLNTGDVFRKGEIDMGKLMIAVVKFATAHDESAKKSFRLASAWKHKRAMIGSTALTRIVPNWLEIEHGKIIADPEKAATVKQIFGWAMQGHGIGAICRLANASLKSVGRKPHFVRSYIAKILHSRAVVGEFQPHTVKYVDGKKTRQPEGEPIKDYYPAIIDEQTFYAVQTRMTKNRYSGGPNTNWTNLFKGLLFNAEDGSRLQVQDKGQGRRYVSSAAIEGRKGAADYIGLPVTYFEAAFVYLLGGCNVIDFGDTDDKAERLRIELDAVESQVAAVAERATEIKAALVTTGASAVSLVEVLATLDTQRAAFRKRRDALQSELQTMADGTPKDVVDQIVHLVHCTATSNLSASERLMTKNLVSRLVERIECLPVRDGNGDKYSATMTVIFHAGPSVQYVMKWHRKITNVARVLGLGYDYFLRLDYAHKPTPRDEAMLWTPHEWVQAVKKEGIKPLAARIGVHWSNVYRQIAKA